MSSTSWWAQGLFHLPGPSVSSFSVLTSSVQCHVPVRLLALWFILKEVIFFLSFFLSISHYWQEEKLLILISHVHGSCLLVQRAFWESRASSVQDRLCKWQYFDVFLHYPCLIHSLFLSCGLAKTSRTDFVELEWRSGICLLFLALVVPLDLSPVLRRVGDRLGRYLLCYVVMKGCCSLSKVFADTLKTTTRLLFWSLLIWCLTCVY